MYFTTVASLISHYRGNAINDDKKLLILAGEKEYSNIKALTDELNQLNISFCGGIYPSLIVGADKRKSGYIVKEIQPIFSSIAVPYMMPFRLKKDEIKGCTVIVMADGLSPSLEAVCNTVRRKLGNEVTYVGGACGMSDMVHTEVLFDNHGMYKDAMYINIVKRQSDVLIRHGWTQIYGPYKGKSEGNTVSTVADLPIYEVYKDIIEDNEGTVLNSFDLFNHLSSYPLGVKASGDTDIIIRAPLKVNEDDQSIMFSGAIIDGSDFYIMNGTKDSLLDSLVELKSTVRQMQDGYEPILFECLARDAYLDDDFKLELAAIQNAVKGTLEGAVTFGELSSKANGELIMHNCSAVLGLIY